MTLADQQIAILTADHAVERVEPTEPSQVLIADRPFSECDPAEFDGLVWPGGYINPDKLRRDPNTIMFTRSFFEPGKPVGVLCR